MVVESSFGEVDLMASIAGYPISEFIVVMIAVYVFAVVASILWAVRQFVEGKMRAWFVYVPIFVLVVVYALLLLPVRIGTMGFFAGLLVAYIVWATIELWRRRGIGEDV